MKIVYVILLFTGYISVFASLTMFTADFPSDFMMKIFLLSGLWGAVLVYKTQSEIALQYQRREIRQSDRKPHQL